MSENHETKRKNKYKMESLLIPFGSASQVEDWNQEAINRGP